MSKIRNGLRALDSANNFIKNYEKDHYNTSLNYACFMLQSSMEFFIKGIIEFYEEKPVFSHLICYNSDILQNLCNKVPELKEIDNTLNECNKNANIFANWNIKYGDNDFKETKENIDIAFKICNELKDYIYKHKLV